MTEQETAAILALLSAAFWNGRPIPTATAKLYAEHLRPLDIEHVRAAVDEIIDTNTTGYYPAVGAIVERANAFRKVAVASKPILEAPRWVEGAPWFIHLQMARMSAGLPAGYPLKELVEEGGREALMGECQRLGVDVTLQEMSRWPK